MENLAYALAQVLHNFGAVMVTGGAAFALWAREISIARESRLARAVALGWVVQIASGAGFGAVSYYYYARLPEIHGVAIIALGTKMACAAAGLALSLLVVVRQAKWTEGRRRLSWGWLTGLAVTALAAAAFLRWFS